MRKVEYYEANDGTLFNNIEACQDYEKNSKQRIIERFKKLIVRENEGIQITNEGSAFPFAEISECWWFAVIVMKNEDDYNALINYAKLVITDNKWREKNLSRIQKIFDKEIILGIGDGSANECEYTYCYWWCTVDEAIEEYKNAIMTFGKESK